MKLLSFHSDAGRNRVGIVSADTVIDATSLTTGAHGISAMRQLLQATGGVIDEEALDGLPRVALADVEVAPVVPDPGKIIAAPVNYRDHQAEMNEDAHIDELGVFLKAPSSVTADGTHVALPYTDRRFDQEGELALIIGRTARNVAPDEAESFIAGYTCLLDMTMRGGEDRSTRKSFDTFTPVGPYLVTKDEVGAVSTLRLRTQVNDVMRQDADISDLIWNVPALIGYISSVMTLHPGDIVTTGTPAGIGQVHDGDTITVEIDRVGRLTVAVTADGAVVCPTKGANRGPKPPAEVTPVRDRASAAN